MNPGHELPSDDEVFEKAKTIKNLPKDAAEKSNTEVIDFLKSLAEFIQEMQLCTQSGQKGPPSPRRSIQQFVRRCKEKKISACIFIKKTSPATKKTWSKKKLVSVKYAILRNWPQEEASLHVHITCELCEVLIRHIEVLPEYTSVEAGKIEIEIQDFPGACMPTRNEASNPLPKPATPSEGNVLSEAETRRFLESMGLEDIL
ncbi:MAG: hypothetical protein HYW90_02955 [Candidatus Sungbacteria bacterium]|nr:hypothetical protein [Candidatus Sungbacteria bacterium]